MDAGAQGVVAAVSLPRLRDALVEDRDDEVVSLCDTIAGAGQLLDDLQVRVDCWQVATMSIGDRFTSADPWLHAGLANGRGGAFTRLLLEHGATVCYRAAYGGRHLHAARAPGAVRALVAAGANVHEELADGQTPLHACAVSADPLVALSTLHALLDAGADPLLVDANGKTPLAAVVRLLQAHHHYVLEEKRALRPRLVPLARAEAWHRRRHLLLAIRTRSA